MIAKHSILAGALALLAGASFVHLAAGEPEALQRSVESADPERAEVAPSESADPQLVVRLTQLESARRAARVEGLKDPKAWADGRLARASRHRAEIAEVWGDVALTVDAQARLRLHAERMSRLHRLLDLAELGKDKVLLARLNKDVERELARHARAMQTVGLGGAE